MCRRRNRVAARSRVKAQADCQSFPDGVIRISIVSGNIWTSDRVALLSTSSAVISPQSAEIRTRSYGTTATGRACFRLPPRHDGLRHRHHARGRSSRAFTCAVAGFSGSDASAQSLARISSGVGTAVAKTSEPDTPGSGSIGRLRLGFVPGILFSKKFYRARKNLPVTRVQGIAQAT